MKKAFLFLLIGAMLLPFFCSCVPTDVPSDSTVSEQTERTAEPISDTSLATETEESAVTSTSGESTIAKQTTETTKQTTETTTKQTTGTTTKQTTETTSITATSPVFQPVTDAAVQIRFNATVKSKTNIFQSPNQCTFSLVQNPDDPQNNMLKLTTSAEPSNDPYITFHYANYATAMGVTKISAASYPFVAIRIKSESITKGNFELFFCAGTVKYPSADASMRQAYDPAYPEWQWLVFDLSNAKWKGTVSSLRLDFTSDAGKDEVLYVSEIDFFQTDLSLYRYLNYGSEEQETAETPAQKQLVDTLLSADDPSLQSAYYTAQKQAAAYEDAALTLTFQSLTERVTKTAANLGTDSILLRMAKNEIEGTQAILAASSAKTGLKIYVTDFENKAGKTLETDLLWGYYFDVNGETVADTLPPVKYEEDLAEGDLDWNNCGNHAGALIPNFQKYGGFDIPAGENQMFVIKAHTAIDSQVGEYTATVTVKDQNGNEVKKATVYLWVWDFYLPEATSCKTMTEISWAQIYTAHRCYQGDDGYLYQLYYDYLLENRLCGYDIPYNKKGGDFSDSRVVQYLDNPRVTAFQVLGWHNSVTNDILQTDKIAKAFQYLSQKESWLEKSYFYPIDEPILSLDSEILNKVNQNGILLSEYFPGYQLIVPMSVDEALTGGDYFSYVSDFVNVWCPHVTFFSTYYECMKNSALTYQLTLAIENQLGKFPARMEEEQNGGDEVWWYVTHTPNNPEISLLLNTDSVNYRILFWQQKLYGVDGFLYYSSTDWYASDAWQLTNPASYIAKAEDFPGYSGAIEGSGAPAVASPVGLNSKHETNAEVPFDAYGNGVLVYVGQYFGEYGPVGSFRLECVRDGIEDYEYLTLLEEKLGRDTVNLIIRRITSSVGSYTDDATYFRAVRDSIGNLLASLQ